MCLEFFALLIRRQARRAGWHAMVSAQNTFNALGVRRPT
jgi:hypothetical protein